MLLLHVGLPLPYSGKNCGINFAICVLVSYIMRLYCDINKSQDKLSQIRSNRKKHENINLVRISRYTVLVYLSVCCDVFVIICFRCEVFLWL